MTELYLHGRKLESIFELLGTGENDITYSIGWAMSQSPNLLQVLVSRVCGRTIDAGDVSVFLQKREDDGGLTDIEVIGPGVHLIVEAKREPLFVYALGEPIIPRKDVKAGRIQRAARVWAMIDLLLTCDTISDACEITKKRRLEDK